MRTTNRRAQREEEGETVLCIHKWTSKASTWAGFYYNLQELLPLAASVDNGEHEIIVYFGLSSLTCFLRMNGYIYPKHNSLQTEPDQ